MKKSILITIVLITTLFAVGCQNDIIDQTITDNNPKGGKNLSTGEEYAIRTAKDFISNFTKTTRATHGKTVGDVYVLRNEMLSNTTRADGQFADTVAYIVNYKDNEGFVIVDSKDSTGCILAYIEEGHYSPFEEINNPEFKLYLDCIRYYYSGPGEPTIPIVDSTHVIVGPVPPRPYYDEHEGYWEIDSIIAPLLTTKWGQWYPFNTYCFTSTGAQAAAGCVPIAVSQVVTYHGFPSTINGHPVNWNIIQSVPTPTTDSAKELAASLVAHVGSLMPDIDYGEEETGATLDDCANSLEELNYIYNFGMPSYSELLTEFNADRPVIFNGLDLNRPVPAYHSWVIDGALTRSFYSRLGIDNTSYTLQTTQNLVHCNWGWNGSCNGYYLYNLLKLSEKVLNDDLSDYTGTISDDLWMRFNLSCFYGIRPDL